MKSLFVAIIAVLSINAAYAKGGAHGFAMHVPHSTAKAPKEHKPHALRMAGMPASHLAPKTQGIANDAMAKIDAIADGIVGDGQ
jgi:hypothetical protein